MFSTNVVKFKEPGVGVVEFVGCVSDLFGETNGGEKLVGEGGVNPVETFAPVV